MSREKDCKWHFGPESLKQADVLAAMAQMFNENPYNSLIREAIQNSLDAVYDENYPVKVEFSFKQFNSIEFPHFFEVRKHVKAVADFFKDKEQYALMYNEMYNQIPDVRFVGKIDYIRVSDYNAKGMRYSSTDNTSPFDSFVRSAGIADHDNNASGGAFGFGHSAYFQMSPYRTVLVSTLTKDDQYVFEGTVNIGTHKGVDENGNELLLSGVGYYDNNNGKPVTDSERIPSPFRRKSNIADAPHDKYKYGTDINIMGVDLTDKDHIIEEMIRSVLENYWFAILDKKLEVVIDEHLINYENLDEEMSQRYNDAIDRKRDELNPRAYYECVKYSNSSDGMHPLIKGEAGILGKVKMYVTLNEDVTSDRVVFMRKPKMMVYRHTYRNKKGFYGVFLCDNEKGNELLRHLENSSHSEWNAKNYRDIYKRPVPEGEKAVEAVFDFVEYCKEQLFRNIDRNQEDIAGSYLTSINEDNDLANTTKRYSGVTNEDGNIISSSINDKAIIPNVKQKRTMLKIVNGDVEENGDDDARIHQRTKDKNKGRGKGNNSGGKKSSGKSDGKSQNKYGRPIDSGVRTIGTKLIVYVGKSVSNATLEIMANSEKQGNESVTIEKASFMGKSCEVAGGKLKNINLEAGKNIIDLTLADSSLKPSLNVRIYENK